MQSDNNQRGSAPAIGVVGVGGCGRDVLRQLAGYDNDVFTAVAIDTEDAPNGGAESFSTLMIGRRGTGGNPAVAQRLFEDNISALEDCFRGKDALMIVAGLGGGTGSGIAPLIAQRAKSERADTLVVAIVTMPFAFEGRKRQKTATEALRQIDDAADVVVVIDNNRMPLLGNVSLVDAFGATDGLMAAAVRGIASFVTLDDEDIQCKYTMLRKSGRASVFTAKESGEHAAAEALAQLQSSPLTDIKDMARCRRLFLMIETPQERSLLLPEFSEISDVVTTLFDDKDADSGRMMEYSIGLAAMDCDLRITVLAFAVEGEE